MNLYFIKTLLYILIRVWLPARRGHVKTADAISVILLIRVIDNPQLILMFCFGLKGILDNLVGG